MGCWAAEPRMDLCCLLRHAWQQQTGERGWAVMGLLCKPRMDLPTVSRCRFLTSWLLSALTVLIIPPVFLMFFIYGRLSRR